MDTSTGSFTDCPSADLYKEQEFCTTDQIGFTHQWFHAMQSFLMQPLTNCQGSAPFPEFARFTTLLGRVRLTQQEWDKLERNAQELGISSAELMRDYIKSLANLPASGASNPSQQP